VFGKSNRRSDVIRNNILDLRNCESYCVFAEQHIRFGSINSLSRPKAVYNFILFKFLKDVVILILYTLLDISILNPDLSFDVDTISLNEMERIIFRLLKERNKL